MNTTKHRYDVECSYARPFLKRTFLFPFLVILNMILKLNIKSKNIINGGDVQRKNVVNNVDKSSFWAP